MIKKIVVESHDSSPEGLLRRGPVHGSEPPAGEDSANISRIAFRQPNQCGAFVRRSLSSDHAGDLLAQRFRTHVRIKRQELLQWHVPTSLRPSRVLPYHPPLSH